MSSIQTYLAKTAMQKYHLQLSREQWIQKGTTDFKRKIMGLCGTKTEKTEEELEDILLSLHNSNLSQAQKEEIKTITHSLDNVILTYDWGTLHFYRKNTENASENVYLIIKK